MRRLARVAVLTLGVALAAGCGSSGGSASGPSAPGVAELPLTVCAPGTTLPGIDVSKYQGQIDWSKVAGSGVVWAYAEASRCAKNTSYTVDLDPIFPTNWAQMKQNGVVRGAYHLFCPNVDGKAQADAFLDHVGTLEATDLPPMLDWEKNEAGASYAVAEANAQAFLDEVEARTGRRPVIYTSPGLWPNLSHTSFASYDLWVANWNVQCPTMPGDWTDWVFWQHTSKGSVPGISGNVDLDWFNGDRAALGQIAGGATCDGPVGHPVGQGGAGTACTGSAPQVDAPGTCGALQPGQGLLPGQHLASCDHRFVLALTSTGDLKLFAHGNLAWDAGTGGQHVAALVMRSGGDLVLASDTGCAVWHSGTGGNAGAALTLGDDGELSVSAGGTVLWSAGTGAIPPVPATCGTFAAGEGLGPGDRITSCGGCYALTLQGDGDLVVQRLGDGTVVWKTGTTAGYALEEGPDGDLVLYDAAGCTLWSSGTGGNAGALATLEDDGNLEVTTAAGATLWSAGTIDCTSGPCTCTAATDGGTPGDGGGGPVDGGATGDGGPGSGGGGGGGVPSPGGCGCSATGGAPAGLGLVVVLALGLRRRRPLTR